MDKRKLVKEMARELAAVNRMTRAEVGELQERKLRRLLRHAVERSPYYREAFAGVDVATAPLGALPVLDKRRMMARFDDVVTDPEVKVEAARAHLADPANEGELYLGRYMVLPTSGSTGEAAIVVCKVEESLVYQAAWMARCRLRRPLTPGKVAWLLLRGLVKPWRTANVLLLAPRPGSGYLASRHAPPLPYFLKNRFFNIADPFDKLVRDLDAYKPQALFGAPSILQALAEEQLAGRLDLRFAAPISAITSAGEPLWAETRARVREAWGMEIIDAYGTTELGTVAMSCDSYERMRVMSDLAVVEVVDRQNRPVPDGERGDKLLVTNLQNYTLPLIRYEIDDVTGFVAGPDPSPLPFPALLSVDGRLEDNFYLHREDGSYLPVRPEAFEFLVEIPAIRKFQVLQTGRNQLRLRYVPRRADHDPAAVRREVEAWMARLPYPVAFAIEFEAVETIERTPSGKMRKYLNLTGDPGQPSRG